MIRHSTHYFRTLLALLLMLASATTYAQDKISGTVVDNNNKPIKGASVYLDNTLDGGTSDSTGAFHFTTSEKGNQSIVASEISHETAGLPIVITGDMTGIVLHLKRNAVHDLDAVVITAGSFDASNDKTKTVLKPLDIVTTAGAGADVVKAMEMLPGTQKTGTDNGMFVRGGDASEAAIVVDEMVIQSAFLSGPPGVSTRSRFGAFNYQGVSFSSGGYSARYGQALSSVLELNTIDLADKSTVNLGANMAGIYASGVKRWKNASLDFGGNYTNTTPFFSLATTNIDFFMPPTGGSGNIRYAWKPNKNGILKVGLNSSFSSSGIKIPNYNTVDPDSTNPFKTLPTTIPFKTNDQYYFGSISYKQLFKAKYSLYTAASYSLDKTDNKFDTLPIKEQDHRLQYRIEGKDFFSSRLNLLLGSDVQSYGISKSYSTYPKAEFTETIVSGYTELEWTPINMLAVKPGIRYEHSTLLNKDNIAPRLSMAIKTGKHSQVSLAGGIFYQNADNNYLLYGYKPEMQLATHYIANWQYSHNDRTLRLEAYYKKYDKLILALDTPYNANPYRFTFAAPTNNGSGYAQGLELFWRDKKSVKNVDYWLSYSYIDTRRQYSNFPYKATPGFISNHNLNLVGKYFVTKWQTNFSLTYSYASGRPYFNPYKPVDEANFLSDRAPDYHNLAVAVAYLHTFGKWFTVFYISIDNVTDQHNVFGYRYNYDASGNPNGRSPVVPALYRSVFVGVNMSLTQFSKDEL
jgi:CarboxypepD_reg-like domain